MVGTEGWDKNDYWVRLDVFIEFSRLSSQHPSGPATEPWSYGLGGPREDMQEAVGEHYLRGGHCRET